MSRNKTRDTPTASQVHGSETASGDAGRVRRTEHADYQLVPFPLTQRTIAVMDRFTEHRHMIHGLLEVDVTTPRQVIQEQKARGEEPLSFTAFIAACLGKAVDENKAVQAYRKGRPFYFKKLSGTCAITAVGMFGKGSGWGIPATLYSPFLTLGGISEKPGVVDGQIAIREYLCLTISFDHDIVDGAPAARFTERLKELIEGGFGLLDQQVRVEQAST